MYQLNGAREVGLNLYGNEHGRLGGHMETKLTFQGMSTQQTLC